jgi:hypothetical protein
MKGYIDRANADPKHKFDLGVRGEVFSFCHQAGRRFVVRQADLGLARRIGGLYNGYRLGGSLADSCDGTQAH